MSDMLNAALQHRLGYTFADPDLLRMALTHSSASAVNYERLEHLGDAALNLAVAYWLYRDFPRFGPGQMSILRAALVRAPTLAQFAHALTLPETIRLSRHADARGLRYRTTVLSDVFEAVVGALFVDAGGYLAPVEQLTRALAEPLARAVMQQDPDFYEWPVPDLAYAGNPGG